MSNSNSMTDLHVVSACLKKHEHQVIKEAKVIEKNLKKQDMQRPNFIPSFTNGRVRAQQRTSSFASPTRADLDKLIKRYPDYVPP